MSRGRFHHRGKAESTEGANHGDRRDLEVGDGFSDVGWLTAASGALLVRIRRRREGIGEVDVGEERVRILRAAGRA